MITPFKESTANLLGSLRFLIFVTLLFVVAIPYGLLHRYPHFFPLDLGDVHFIGLAPMVLGALAVVWCFWNFGTLGKGTPAPWDPPKELVVKGLYRYLRNPIYVGYFVLIFGEALLFEAGILLAYLFLLFLNIHLTVLFHEERSLKRRFGESYEQYCKAVPRWIPRLRPCPDNESGKAEG